MTADELLPSGRYWAGVVKAGQCLRIVDVEGAQGVDFLCYNADHTAERYHAPNTLKAARTLKLTAGHVLYSDEARPIFTIVEDTSGDNDTIAGCCSAPSNKMLYGVDDCPGCREIFSAPSRRSGWTAGTSCPISTFSAQSRSPRTANSRRPCSSTARHQRVTMSNCARR